MAQVHNSRHERGRILPQSIFDEFQDFAGPSEVICSALICFVICDTVIVGCVVEDEVLLNHGGEAMVQLTVRKTGVEFQARKVQTVISL